MGESLGRCALACSQGAARAGPSGGRFRSSFTLPHVPAQQPRNFPSRVHFTQQRCRQLLQAHASHTHKPAARVRLGPQRGLEQSCRSCVLGEAGGGPWLQASAALPSSNSSIFYPEFRALGLWVKTGTGPRGVGRGVSQVRLGDSEESLPLLHTHTQWSFLFKKYLFIYLAAPDLSCGLQDLVPWPRIELALPASGARSLSHWTTRELPQWSFSRVPAEPRMLLPCTHSRTVARAASIKSTLQSEQGSPVPEALTVLGCRGLHPCGRPDITPDLHRQVTLTSRPAWLPETSASNGGLESGLCHRWIPPHPPLAEAGEDGGPAWAQTTESNPHCTPLRHVRPWKSRLGALFMNLKWSRDMTRGTEVDALLFVLWAFPAGWAKIKASPGHKVHLCERNDNP